MKRYGSVSAAACIASATLLSGCAGTHSVAPASIPPAPGNPVPSQAFAKYGRVLLKPVALAAGAKGRAADVQKIDASLKKNLWARLLRWNTGPSNGRTLVIQPVVQELSFTKASKAAAAGPLAGSPGILIRVQIKDENGRLIANPEFFQRTSAVGAGFTIGVHDKLMIERIADLTSQYILANFHNAVGGESGAGDKVLEAR